MTSFTTGQIGKELVDSFSARLSAWGKHTVAPAREGANALIAAADPVLSKKLIRIRTSNKIGSRFEEKPGPG